MTQTNAADIFHVEDHHTSGVYSKQPIIFVRGYGSTLWDIDGNAYLDCTSGHGAANLGHAHPRITEAVSLQAGKLITLCETYYNDQRAALLAKITSLIPELDRAFFCNSGTESVEAAIKFARLSTKRSQIVAAMRGFHGRTYGSLSATYNKKYRESFEPLVPGFSHVPFNSVEALENAVTEETAAVLLEPVQGEGGVYPASHAYLEAARRICTERGALLIIDEVQTGFGRTGKLFAVQHIGIVPDLLCAAKSLAGGLPMGVTLIGPSVKDLAPGVHGSTFGGNPLACAAVLAVLQVIEDEDLPGQAAAKGTYLIEKLCEIRSPLIREVRGLGLMVGIELRQKVAPFLKLLQERRILTLNAGMTVIRLLPPLIIEYEQIDFLVTALADVLSSTTTRLRDDE